MKKKALWFLAVTATFLFNSCRSDSIPSYNEEPIRLSGIALDSVPPKDVLLEVYYFSQGIPPRGCSYYDFDLPTFNPDMNDDPVSLTDPIYIEICGLPVVGEVVNIRIELPNGSVSNDSTETVEIYGQRYGQLSFRYISDLGDQTGAYHFVFEGSSWTLEKSVNISEIEDPSLIQNGSELILLNFRPREKVRLFVYFPSGQSAIAQLTGWTNLQVNSNGQLIIRIDDPNVIYVVVGEISGEVHHRSWTGGQILKP